MKTQTLSSHQKIELLESVKCTAIFSIIFSLIVVAAGYSNYSLLKFILLFASGWLTWTYLEYFLHRFWMHNHFKNLNSAVFEAHMYHHKHPQEIKINGFHRTILTTGGIFISALAILMNNYFTIFLGFYIGMTFYSLLHILLHKRWGKYIFPNIQKAHMHHHGRHPDKGFSFSTIIWDWMFGTLPPKEEVITEKMLRFYFKHDNEKVKSQKSNINF
jgi:hypothetical protein